MATPKFLRENNLSEEDVKKVVSDKHIAKFSRFHGKDWKFLPPYLEVVGIVVNDIDGQPISVEEKRLEFFKRWKNERGCAATYKALINALLCFGCKEDAESLCEMLKEQPESDPDLPGPSSNKKDPGSSLLDPNVLEDLEFQLDSSLRAIGKKYASFVSCLCDHVIKKCVDTTDLYLHLVNLPAFKSECNYETHYLFASVSRELGEAKTITEIFCILSEKCTNFLNCDIFQDIMEHYKISIDCEELNYMEHLKEYLNKHKVSEFVRINPKLKEFEGTEKLHIKLNIDPTTKLNKIFNIKHRICEILGLTNSSLLQILSIEEGCVLVTFLLPKAVADVIFKSDPNNFTKKQKEEFRKISILWLKCKDQKFAFTVKGKQFGLARLPLSGAIRKILEKYPDGQIFKVSY